MFAIKAEVRDPSAPSFAFGKQKTMYGGKHIAKGDVIFIFASENEGGSGAKQGSSHSNPGDTHPNRRPAIPV